MQEFLHAIRSFVDEFKKHNDKVIRLVSHLDADGLSSSAIMIRALKREGIKFSLTTIRQLNAEVIDELTRENYPIVMFLDLASGSLSEIEAKLCKNKTVFIIDHHKVQEYKYNKIKLLNPHIFGIDGSKEISSSGITYLFAKYINPKNLDMSSIAILGAIGDMQEHNGFKSELNNFILEDAINSGKIEIKVGLRMFGMQTRPINKVLEYSTDPYIPGVTGSEQGTKRFLEKLKINVIGDGKYRKLVQLRQEELKQLVTGIILQRMGSEENPEDVLGKVYLLPEEEDENPMKDAKEFSTLLNACGRMNRSSIGIACCLSDKKAKQEAITLLLDYKKEIINSLNWFHSNKNKMIEGEGYVIINAQDQIKDTLIGTMGSMIAKSNTYSNGDIIITMAYTIDGHIKISLRVAGTIKRDLIPIINKIVSKVGGIGGGHKYAAGALIHQEKEREFIQSTKELLEKEFIKEKNPR